jgi:AbiV
VVAGQSRVQAGARAAERDSARGVVQLMLSEETLRLAAAACFDNALALYAEASLLYKTEKFARASALAAIAVEEFAKSIICLVAATVVAVTAALSTNHPYRSPHRASYLVFRSRESAPSKRRIKNLESRRACGTQRWSCSSASWRAGRSSCAGSTAGGRSPRCSAGTRR